MNNQNTENSALAEEGYRLFNLIPQNSVNILDLGCNAASILPLINANTNKNWKYVGLKSISETQTISQKPIDSIIETDLNELKDIPFSHGYFDCVFAIEILHNLVDPVKVLSNLLPYLTKEGVIICSIFNLFHHSKLLALLDGRRFISLFNLRPPVRLWSFPEFLELANSAGLEIENQISCVVTEANPLLEKIYIEVEKDLGATPPYLKALSSIYKYLFKMRQTQEKTVNQKGMPFSFIPTTPPK